MCITRTNARGCCLVVNNLGLPCCLWFVPGDVPRQQGDLGGAMQRHYQYRGEYQPGHIRERYLLAGAGGTFASARRLTAREFTNAARAAGTSVDDAREQYRRQQREHVDAATKAAARTRYVPGLALWLLRHSHVACLGMFDITSGKRSMATTASSWCSMIGVSARTTSTRRWWWAATRR